MKKALYSLLFVFIGFTTTSILAMEGWESEKIEITGPIMIDGKYYYMKPGIYGQYLKGEKEFKGGFKEWVESETKAYLQNTERYAIIYPGEIVKDMNKDIKVEDRGVVDPSPSLELIRKQHGIEPLIDQPKIQKGYSNTAVGLSIAGLLAIAATSYYALKWWQKRKINNVLAQYNQNVNSISPIQLLLLIAAYKRDKNKIKQLIAQHGNGELKESFMLPAMAQLFYGAIEPNTELMQEFW